MTLPYATATSGKRALTEAQKALREFGVDSFGSMMDYHTGELIVQFKYRGRLVSLRANAKGYAVAWLKRNPWTHRKQASKADWEERALRQGEIAVNSILRDWIKAQITAVETGMLSFDAAFLAHIMLPSGRTVMNRIESDNLLPQLEHEE